MKKNYCMMCETEIDEDKEYCDECELDELYLRHMADSISAIEALVTHA